MTTKDTMYMYTVMLLSQYLNTLMPDVFAGCLAPGPRVRHDTEQQQPHHPHGQTRGHPSARGQGHAR